MAYYSRQTVLPEVGYEGQTRFKDSKVCLVGLGGLGSRTAIQLATMGTGHMRIVDYDVVEISNLQRQILYDINVLGCSKVEIAAKRLVELNPYVNIEPLSQKLDFCNANTIIQGMDLVVDGLDNMTARYALNKACQELGVPYIFAAAIINFGIVSTILPDETPCLECFYGNAVDNMLPKTQEVGVNPNILGIVSSIEVSEAVRLILGNKPNLAAKLIHCDINYLDFDVINITKALNCPVCGDKPTESKN